MTTVVRLHLTPATPVGCKGKKTGKLTGPQRRTHARAIKRIFDKSSGDLVGWLYEWNTGEVVPRWKSEVHKDVFYE